MQSRGIYGAVQCDYFFFFFTSESKIVEEVKIKPGRNFKRYFKQTENALLFSFFSLSADIFPIFL